MIRKRIYVQGNSIVVGFPRYLLEEVGARIGDSFEIRVVGPGKMMLEVRSKRWVEDQERRLWGDRNVIETPKTDD